MSADLELLMKPAGIAPPERLAPGARAHLEWLPLAALRIDPAYQRPLTAKGLKTIAAVNGQVTPLSIAALYKAARAAGEGWALAIDRVAAAAGVRVMTWKEPKSRMRPFETLAIGTLRNRIAHHGEDKMTAVLRHLVAQPGADEPGFVTASRIDAALGYAPSTHGRAVMHVPTPAAVAAADVSVAGQIRELKRRNFSTQAIATRLRCTYAEIERATKGEA